MLGSERKARLPFWAELDGGSGCGNFDPAAFQSETLISVEHSLLCATVSNKRYARLLCNPKNYPVREGS